MDLMVPAPNNLTTLSCLPLLKAKQIFHSIILDVFYINLNNFNQNDIDNSGKVIYSGKKCILFDISISLTFTSKQLNLDQAMRQVTNTLLKQ